MMTSKWKTERIADGRYRVRLTPIGETIGSVIPGIIIGGNGRWFVEVGGNMHHTPYKTRNSAACALVCMYYDI